jgi:hypothetical protein
MVLSSRVRMLHCGALLPSSARYDRRSAHLGGFRTDWTGQRAGEINGESMHDAQMPGRTKCMVLGGVDWRAERVHVRRNARSVVRCAHI